LILKGPKQRSAAKQSRGWGKFKSAGSCAVGKGGCKTQQHFRCPKVEAGMDWRSSSLLIFPLPRANTPDSSAHPDQEPLPPARGGVDFSRFSEGSELLEPAEARACQLRVQPAILLRETHWV